MFKTLLAALIVRIGTEFKAVRTMISGTGTGDVSALTAGTNLVEAINKNTTDVAAAQAAATAAIGSDSVVEGTTNLFFTDARADARIAIALEGEDLSDLAAAVTANANANAGQLYVNAPQSLTPAQIAFGLDNLKLGAGLDTYDMVAEFNAAVA